MAILRGEERKAHSPQDLDLLTTRDISEFFLESAAKELAQNAPQRRVWMALRDEAATFPLRALEEFARGVAADTDDPEALSENLWRLGLLRDDNLLGSSQGNATAADRLNRNREALLKMRQLGAANRQRMSSALGKAPASQATEMRAAFRALSDFYRRGDPQILRRLELGEVERLLDAGRPLPTPATSPAPVEVQDDESENDEMEEETAPAPAPVDDRPLRGRELQQEISNLVVGRSAEQEEGLRELGEELRARMAQEQPSKDDVAIESGFGGRSVQPELPSSDVRAFVGMFCADGKFGGELKTPRLDLKDAIRNAEAPEVGAYNPDDVTQGTAGQSLFSLLRSFDAHVPPTDAFSEALDRFLTARGELLKDLDLLLASPLVLFGGFPNARLHLQNYLAAYSDLLRRLIQHNPELHGQDAEATRYVCHQLLRLDVICVRTPDEVKAVLTPLHPFHLWRYQEIFKALHIDQQELSEEEQAQLAEALRDLPHLLHFVIVPGAGNSDARVLPQAGSYEGLPTYENRTNRYLGADGTEFLGKMLDRWLFYAPYSKPQIRVALVDAPDLGAALREAATFLTKNSRLRPPPKLVLDAYYTPIRNRHPAGELARLDYDGADYEVAELLRCGRLTVHVRPRLDNAREVARAIEKQPVHIAYFFDQSQYRIDSAPRAHLMVSPLVVTYEYSYSDSFKRGTIAPSSEAQDGVFADFHTLVERAGALPQGQLPHLRFQDGSDAELQPINGLLGTGATRWLALADRVLTAYAPDPAVPLGEVRQGQREIGVWAGSSSQAVDRFVDLLRNYNLQPDPKRVESLLRRFGHIAAGGLFTLPTSGISAGAQSGEKGLIGTLLGATWYTTRYPGALAASLDSDLARLWLRARPQGAERTDLIGLRVEGENIFVEPLEIKTRSDGAEVTATDAAGGRRQLSGKAIDQLLTMLATVRPIFGEADTQPLFTPARREVLKYQIYRECFREVHEDAWQREWYERLEKLFAQPHPDVTVRFEGTVVHVHLEAAGDERRDSDPAQSVSLVTLGTASIQKLIVAPDTSSPTPVASHVPLGDAPSQGNQVDPGATVATENVSADNPVTEFAADATDIQDDDSVDMPGTPQISAEIVTPADTASVQPSDAALQSPSREEAVELSRLFLRACQSFRIQVDECDPARAIAGPNVWRFYVRLSRTQRLDPLRSVLDDVGRQMRRSGLLIAIVPNSEEITLDVPRSNRASVNLVRALERLGEISSPEQMPIPIGITPEGNHIIRDLGQMPHLLVGGTTGSGKTMFLYGILAALISSHPNPTTLRLLLSTSKPEDFVFFAGLPHLETGQVISDAGEAVRLLQNHVPNAFDERLAQLTAARCRDIGEYNARHEIPLAPLLVIVDEFADLSDQLASNRSARDAFYTQIRRIAQLGRSRGVHLVLCTQRPSADLVPTNIRNLMNARVALHVNDATASRMILDESGAEQLQRHGDLLFKEQNTLTRAQGYFVTGEELDSLLRDST